MVASPICDTLGIQYPVFQGGMAWIADGKLAAAVSNAGGLGIISAMNAGADYVREQIRIAKSLTDKPFGVNIMLMSPFVKEVMQVVIDERVKVITTGAGNPGEYMPALKEIGTKVIPVVASVALDKRLVRAGADAVIAEGTESGGHIGEITTMALLPQVVDAVEVPVIGAGGIGDSRGMAAAFALGAQAVQMGSRFVLSEECIAHENYKNMVLKAKDRSTVVTGSVLLILVNIGFSDAVLGARNWLSIGGLSLQPSELLKVGYIYVGASTLERLFHRNNLTTFIGFSAFRVVSLALIGDFGTAPIFFVPFLVIAYLRSGSFSTVFLAVAGAGMAAFLAVSIKPYIAGRFTTWGHVWEDVYNTGFQQTRAMSAAAAGGLYGKGAGAGWLKDVVAANTDMVFAMVCEEQGLIIAVIMVIAMLVLALFAVRSARHGRSAYYSIAACAAMSMLLTQLALNVFGSLDILPFTGVTFPFVSRGGTSLLSCWMLMAFIKSADNRKHASFAVRPGERLPEGGKA
jgi:enoyl-[acyl-carrier protein] reductase II